VTGPGRPPQGRLPLAQVRRIAIAAQGYAPPRRSAGRSAAAAADAVHAEVRRLTCVQLDSISTVERSHRIALTSRVGRYPQGTVSRLLGEGRLFEYWAHEACLLAVEDWPLLRPRMAERRVHHWYGPFIDEQPALADEVLAAIRERGPLGSKDFEGAGSGGMWNWKPAKRMLDALWTAGELAVAGRTGFQKLYDLTERVIPAAALAAPVPAEPEWLAALAVRAVEGRGALTASGIREHWRLDGGVKRLAPHLDRLVAEGALRCLAVEDGGAPVYVGAGTELDPDPPTGAHLLSPFDNLLWDRPFAERVLAFDHLIEVYKREHERQFGYYVLPLLWRDRLVGRADLKADRAEGVLRCKAFHREQGVRDSAALAAALEGALAALAGRLGLDRIETR
jgi:uncharacterized protein YcaQ